MDRDEDSQQAIIREAQEESGCAISDLTLLQVIDYPHRTAEVRQNIAFVYIAHTTDDFVTGNEEVQDLAWFSLDALPPPEEIAFDHVQMLELYKKYLTTPFTLPIVGKPHSS